MGKNEKRQIMEKMRIIPHIAKVQTPICLWPGVRMAAYNPSCPTNLEKRTLEHNQHDLIACHIKGKAKLLVSIPWKFLFQWSFEVFIVKTFFF